MSVDWCIQFIIDAPFASHDSPSKFGQCTSGQAAKDFFLLDRQADDLVKKTLLISIRGVGRFHYQFRCLAPRL